MVIITPQMLAVYLKDYRKQKNLTQAEVANQVGLRQATISDFEKNPNKVTIETFFKIVTALGLEIHLLPKSENEEGVDIW
ncbi:helix-turn-helix domain-containing protein [Phocoenobacter skyensis]|uniref:HTH-type transcriptional regulator / antitoxin HipB n=1 Tax=Phocoenobacter skyensis TaxID=97481 RepID=A0A1H7YE70_9PAST|nr:helix-turn-helix domain-containing protein [Pasteurella skyensis]MDP8079741.1 helix-turn-helix domain-containing protein [Pasteurella skyensis]MDP8085684.1 helix-turn-helix domain-containing protein [Pasteurella skyensis]MDP8170949.1 helix-turn-helix domain-containing protein [Pasteurella skyensis]MDP8175195.1 helix-turn-helix domain-containing protein [Pasteurella skyensis]MDP8185453.1 helix-turn-helix domain-containing protein [Pasteurella skyensis]